MRTATPLRVLLYRTANPYHTTPFSEKAPSLGLMSIAGYVRRHMDCEIRFMDGAEGDSLRRFGTEVGSWQPHVVGISALTAVAYDGMVAATVVRRASPDTLVVVGGTHYTEVPEETLRICTDIDVVLLGEGEQSFLELCQALADAGGRGPDWKECVREVAGLAFLEGEGPALDDQVRPVEDRPMHFTPSRPPIPDLGVLGLPAYDLHTPSRYRMWPWTWSDMTLGEASRGCPYRCSFCHNSKFWEYRWRPRPVENVLDQMEYLVTRLGHRNFYMVDDSFGTKISHVVELCEGILRRGLDVDIWSQWRIDDLDRARDHFELMNRAGFYGLLVGYESPAQGDLDRWEKRAGVDKALELSDLLAKHFPTIMGTFLVGDHQTDADTFPLVREFAEKLHVDIMLMMTFTPVPPTIPIWKEYLDIPNLDVEWDYDLAGMYRGGVSTRYLDREEVVNRNGLELLKFYFNPQNMAHALRSGRLTRRHYYHFIFSGIVDAVAYKARLEGRAKDPRPMSQLRETYRHLHIDWSKRRHQEQFAAAQEAAK